MSAVDTAVCQSNYVEEGGRVYRCTLDAGHDGHHEARTLAGAAFRRWHGSGDKPKPRTWHLPTIPADVTRVTANGALYERDKDRPSRWYQLNSVHARVVGGSCELGQLFQVAGPDGIREAVPE